MTSPTVHRPGLVTLLVVLVVISGILSVIGGVLLLIVGIGTGIDVDGMSGGVIIALAIIAILFGVIYLAVAKGLSNGNPVSRTIVAIVTVLHLIGNLYTAFARTDNSRSTAIGGIIFGVIILAILFSPKANEFFASRG
jgi:hypothetical protein